jgi:phosphoribosylglycinamide formyltransferase-1
MPAKARIVVLISGQGRNLQALIAGTRDGRVPGQIVGVISNRADAPGLLHAASAGIGTQIVPHQDFASREAFDAALAQGIDPLRPDIVVLAGFMRVLGADFVQRYRGRLLNIHPSLLPRHPGLKTHEKVLAAGDAEHGATVHFVTEQLDGGPAVIQGRFMVRPQDSADILADRVMNEVEQRIYPQAVAWMARGELCFQDGRAWFRGAALESPLGLEQLEGGFR